MKGAGNLLVSVLNGVFGLVLFAVGVEAVREYCVGYFSESVGWGFVSMGVIFILVGIFVLVALFMGFYLAVRGEGFRRTALAATLFLLFSWLLLPLSGMVATYYYNAAAPYVRVSAARAVELGEVYADILRQMTVKYGDTVRFYDDRDEETDAPVLIRTVRAEILPAEPTGMAEPSAEYSVESSVESSSEYPPEPSAERSIANRRNSDNAAGMGGTDSADNADNIDNMGSADNACGAGASASDGENAGLPTEETGKISVVFSYDSRWDRLTAEMDCAVPAASNGKTDWTALERPLAYLNALSAREFFLPTVAETASDEAYADWAWDGYAKQLRVLDPFVYVDCSTAWGADGTPGYGEVFCRFHTLADTSPAAEVV